MTFVTRTSLCPGCLVVNDDHNIIAQGSLIISVKTSEPSDVFTYVVILTPDNRVSLQFLHRDMWFYVVVP